MRRKTLYSQYQGIQTLLTENKNIVPKKYSQHKDDHSLSEIPSLNHSFLGLCLLHLLSGLISRDRPDPKPFEVYGMSLPDFRELCIQPL